MQITLGSPVTETVSLSYNAFGQRASYTVTPAGKAASLVETFKYQGDQLSQVSTSGSSIGTPYTDTYVYTQDGAPLELLRQAQGAHSATAYWYVLDGQGNVVALTDSGGTVVDSYSYDQWGRPLSSSQSVPQQLRYNGYWYDTELGWYWLSVRNYDPVLARFLQPDPSELEGLFSYVYAGDSPSDAADPSGLVSQPLTAGCLLTGNNNYEHNVAVGSSQWVDETTSGGSTDIGPSCELGALLGLVPSHCSGVSAVCMASLRQDRIAQDGPDPIGFICSLSGSWGFFCSQVQHGAKDLAAAAAAIGMSVDMMCKATTICQDIDTIQNNPDPFAKMLAFVDLASWLPTFSDEKLLEIVGVEGATELRTAATVIGCALCFPAGTMVATPHGKQAIQTLKVGDQVLAEDPTTGKVSVERVLAVIHDPASPLIAVKLSDGSTIKVTADHPFWVDKGIDFLGPGWLPARELLPGDQLRTASGAVVTVLGLRYNVGTADVYTLTVADDHDFFVGSAEVLVHNDSACTDIEVLAAAAAKLDRGGVLTKAGRALAKHGSRPGSAFLSVLRMSSSDVNSAAQIIVEDILTHPRSTMVVRHHARFGEIVEVRAPDGRGLRFLANGEFLGFLEP